MARYQHYELEQTKMISLTYARWLLPGTFEHVLIYLVANEIDIGRFAARFKNDDAGGPGSGQAHADARCRPAV